MKKAVYAGSFDPPTNGHVWMIKECAMLYDELVVAIGINPKKNPTFSVEERCEMLKGITKRYPNTCVNKYDNQFLVNYANSLGADFIIRGIRNPGDFEYETAMKYVNSKVNPKITTVFLTPPIELSVISSSLVRDLVGPEGWEDIVEEYVPRNVYNKFLQKSFGYIDKWKSLWEQIGAKGNQRKVYNKVVELYSQPHRFYHNLVHVVHALRDFEDVRNLSDNPEWLEMSLWLHDVIYDPKSTGHEEKSAEFAHQILKDAGIKDDYINLVKQLIMATKLGETLSTNDAKLIADIDIANFGKSFETFSAYRDCVRDEYDFVPEQDFKNGTAQIFESFLKRDSIYHTEFFRQRYESHASENLKKALDSLK
jgi:pantetheine-phosphate adenylyltransferase